jgi:tetratricopeptide (TPR) repeat protein
VDIVDVADHEDQVDLTVQFNCSVRYVTHLPASEGAELRVQLQPLPDCGILPGGQIAGELPPVSGGEGIVTAIRVEGDVPGQITLMIQFKKSERFVLAQGVDPRGLRIRLIDRARGRGKILLSQPTDSVNNFAINLDSQPKPFDPKAVQLAHERLAAPAFVSEAVVDGQKWYRLRIGPIERRVEAERLLNRALPDYPRAWMAIGDDAVTSNPDAALSAPLPGVEPIGSDPPLDHATLVSMLSQARAALSARAFAAAISLLTKLQRQPEFPERVHAQELLGLAHERAGQLAHAKAEYEEYLRRYPNGDAAERILLRLRTLRAASAKAQGGSQESESQSRWRINGGFAQLFRYDGTRVDNGVPVGNQPPGTIPIPNSLQSTTQNSLFNDVDLLARRRGDNIDWLGRVSAGYSKSFAQDSVGDEKRVSVASIEMVNRSLGLLTRLGRQSRNQDGVLGTFDGLFVSYQWRPTWVVNLTAGYPVEETSAGFQTARHFESLAVSYAPRGAHWDASMFAAAQQFDGLRDRQAVGFEGRYLASRTSIIGVLDYDTSFRSLNAASLLGTIQLPKRWSMSFDAERRNSPVLTTRNALIGQPATTLAQLEQVFTVQEIFQFARDRTPITTDYSITATRPLGQRFQFSTTLSAAETGATPASGGVDSQPASGLELTYQAQLYSSSLWRTGDFHVITATYANTQIGKVVGVSASSRFPVSVAWRFGPRLTIDRRNLTDDNSNELTYIPSMLVDYQRERKLLQFEIGGQLGKRDALLQTQNTKRYYVSLSYRIGF